MFSDSVWGVLLGLEFMCSPFFSLFFFFIISWYHLFKPNLNGYEIYFFVAVRRRPRVLLSNNVAPNVFRYNIINLRLYRLYV